MFKYTLEELQKLKTSTDILRELETGQKVEALLIAGIMAKQMSKEIDKNVIEELMKDYK